MSIEVAPIKEGDTLFSSRAVQFQDFSQQIARKQKTARERSLLSKYADTLVEFHSGRLKGANEAELDKLGKRVKEVVARIDSCSSETFDGFREIAEAAINLIDTGPKVKAKKDLTPPTLR